MFHLEETQSFSLLMLGKRSGTAGISKKTTGSQAAVLGLMERIKRLTKRSAVNGVVKIRNDLERSTS